MPLRPVRRPSSSLRRPRRVRTLVLAAMLAAAVVPGTAASASAAAAVCGTDAGSAARVMDGHRGHRSPGDDPNSVGPTRAGAMDARLDSAVAVLKRKGLLDRRGLPSAALRGAFTVKVRAHVITRADGTGGVTRTQLAEQVKVLGAAYAGRTARGSSPTPFTFSLASVDYTADDDWFDWSIYEDTDDEEAKTALHRGGMADLNLYVTGLADGLLGYATFPDEKQGALDGVVVLNDSLPGGAAAPYDLGDTTTHEVGHWLGLFHTFQDGCATPGDMVADTPYQADGDNIFFCRESDDTCSQPGRDPVHNFMSYGDDPCLDRFTFGQTVRQVGSWVAYRYRR
ncbi:MAG: zinc metalloprotease [Nocardioidaceae bacterium]|nr:zinc metalloprotease [Nocardioidaceae bacterium]